MAVGFVWRGVGAFGQVKKNGFVSRLKLGIAARDFLSGIFLGSPLPMRPRQGKNLMGLWRGLQVVQEDF